MLGPLVLERPEEPLRDSIVVAVARATHRAFDAQGSQGLLVRITRVLTAAIAVVQQFAGDPVVHQMRLIERISESLRTANSFDEVTHARDAAEAARSFAKAARQGSDIQNRAAELKLRAEREAGEFLSSLRLHGGNRRSRSPSATLKLKDLGVTKQQSQRWQIIARVPEESFEQYLNGQQ